MSKPEPWPRRPTRAALRRALSLAQEECRVWPDNHWAGILGPILYDRERLRGLLEDACLCLESIGKASLVVEEIKRVLRESEEPT